MIRQDEVLETARGLLKQGADLTDAYEGIEFAANQQEKAFAQAVYNKMVELIKADPASAPIPPLQQPETLPDGSQRFRANHVERRKQAEEAHESGGLELFVYATGDDEEVVTGRVASVEEKEGEFYFTVVPDEAGNQGAGLFH